MIMKLIQYTDKHTEFVNKIYGVVVSKKLTNRGLYKLLATIGLLKSYIYLLCVNDSIIGCGALIKKLNLSTLKIEIWVAGIHILEQYRRQNLGSKLMQLLIDECKAGGNKYIYLYVDKNNIAAINLYHKLGFQIIDTYKHYFKMIYLI